MSDRHSEALLKATCKTLLSLIFEESALKVVAEHQLLCNPAASELGPSVSAKDLLVSATLPITQSARAAILDQIQFVALELNRLNTRYGILPEARLRHAIGKADVKQTKTAKVVSNKHHDSEEVNGNNNTSDVQRLIYNPDSNQLERLVTTFTAVAICQPSLWESLTSQPSADPSISNDSFNAARIDDDQPCIDEDDLSINRGKTQRNSTGKRSSGVAKGKSVNIRLRKVCGDAIAKCIPEVTNFYLDRIMVMSATGDDYHNNHTADISPLNTRTLPTFPSESSLTSFSLLPSASSMQTSAGPISANVASLNRSLLQEALQKGFAARRGNNNANVGDVNPSSPTSGNLASNSAASLTSATTPTTTTAPSAVALRTLLNHAKQLSVFTAAPVSPQKSAVTSLEALATTPTSKADSKSSPEVPSTANRSHMESTGGLTTPGTRERFSEFVNGSYSSTAPVTPETHSVNLVLPCTSSVASDGTLSVERSLFPTSEASTSPSSTKGPRIFHRPPPLINLPSPAARSSGAISPAAQQAPVATDGQLSTTGTRSSLSIVLSASFAESLVRCLCGEPLPQPRQQLKTDQSSLGNIANDGNFDQYFVLPSSPSDLLGGTKSNLNRADIFSAAIGSVRSSEATKEYYGDLFRTFSRQAQTHSRLSGAKRSRAGLNNESCEINQEEEEEDPAEIVSSPSSSLVSSSFIHPLFVPWDRIVGAMVSAINSGKRNVYKKGSTATSKKLRAEALGLTMSDATSWNPFLAHYCNDYSKLHSTPSTYWADEAGRKYQHDTNGRQGQFEAATPSSQESSYTDTDIPAPPLPVANAPFECLLCGGGIYGSNNNNKSLFSSSLIGSPSVTSLNTTFEDDEDDDNANEHEMDVLNTFKNTVGDSGEYDTLLDGLVDNNGKKTSKQPQREISTQKSHGKSASQQFSAHANLNGLLHCRDCNRYIHLRCIFPTQRDLVKDDDDNNKGGFKCHGCRIRSASPILKISGPSNSLLETLVMTESANKKQNRKNVTPTHASANNSALDGQVKNNIPSAQTNANVTEITDSTSDDSNNGGERKPKEK